MVSKDEVLRVAKLARLRVTETELPLVQAKFSAILEHFSNLSEVNTNSVEPLFHAADHMEPRPDVPEPPLECEALLRNAPDQLESSFRIPRVVGGEE